MFLSLGLLGYSSSLRRKNILVIAGGFHGSVSGDVLAYTLPNALSMKRNDKVCSLYGSQIRLVDGSRRKLLHSRADGTEGRGRGGGIGLSQIFGCCESKTCFFKWPCINFCIFRRSYRVGFWHFIRLNQLDFTVTLLLCKCRLHSVSFLFLWENIIPSNPSKSLMTQYFYTEKSKFHIF